MNANRVIVGFLALLLLAWVALVVVASGRANAPAPSTSPTPSASSPATPGRTAATGGSASGSAAHPPEATTHAGDQVGPAAPREDRAVAGMLLVLLALGLVRAAKKGTAMAKAKAKAARR